MSSREFDCIVVGGGHAGAEAGHAAARLGAQTLLITIHRDTIGVMSCNPAIGGLGKGQIVREIDALGGLMGQAIDATGIQFRLLNSSKGPAVQSPRAQADKYKYKDYIRQRLEQTENLVIEEAIAGEVIVKDGKVKGVRCEDGREFPGRTVILTTGTFLRGVMHCGDKQWAGGRLGEEASVSLSDCLRKLGLEVGRLKTGTPPRLDGATIDYEKTEEQSGDEKSVPFSFMTNSIDRKQVPCWITYTNEKLHKVLRAGFRRSPMYTGQIKSTGPRYCPSIETKIERFADKDRHQVFLEPENEACNTIYCNGISTSVPADIQDAMLKLLPGTENAKVVHYGYAIEYDYCPATQLRINLESRKIDGLFLAGQINGTSGYEEAAGQGLVAGINAVNKLSGKEPLVLGREQAYIGVMIDDLLTKEIDEPYRMFTSRAEYRLCLRSDNADRRLTQIGKSVGLVSDERWSRFEKKVADIKRVSEYLKHCKCDGISAWSKLKQPNNLLAGQLESFGEIGKMNVGTDVLTAIAIDAKYEGYLARQEQQIESFRNLENIRLGKDLDYGRISHLRAEAREKLCKFRPFTLGQAGRIGGITPADLTVIQIHLKKMRYSGEK